MQDNIMFVGWNNKIRHLINNLPPSITKDKEILCLAEIKKRPVNLPNNIKLIQGDPNKEDTFVSAKVEHVSHAIIALENDPDTILATMAAQNLNPKIKLSVNIHHSENIKHLERLGVEKIICDEQLAGEQMIKSFYTNQDSRA